MLWDDITDQNKHTWFAQEGNLARTLLQQICEKDIRVVTESVIGTETADSSLLPQALFGSHNDDRSEESEERELLSRISFPSAGFFGTTADVNTENEAFLAKLEELEERFSAHSNDPASEVVALQEIRAALSDDELLLHYCVIAAERNPAKELAIFALARDKNICVSISLRNMAGSEQSGTLYLGINNPATNTVAWDILDSSPLGVLVHEFRKAIQDGQNQAAQESARELFELLVTPVLKTGLDFERYRTWIIVPTGVLNAVPFGALFGPDGHYLIEKTSIVTVPSASVWLKLRRRSARIGDQITLFANPNLDSTKWDKLPLAGLEIEDIQKRAIELRPVSRTQGAASFEALVNESGRSRILHLATHGEFPSGNAFDEHALLLAGVSGVFRLRSVDVRRLDLRACKLVTLSLCNGGIYRFGAGNEPLGLVPSFMLAGAENVLAPLWPVEDAACHSFMSSFYATLGSCNPADAVRRASIELLRNGHGIQQWSAFRLAGAGRGFKL